MTPDIIYYLNPAETLPESNYFSSTVDHRWKLTVASYCQICQNFCTNYKELKTAAAEISGIMISGMVLGVAQQTAAAEDQIWGLWEGYCVKRLNAMSKTVSSLGRQYSLAAGLHHDLDMNPDSLHVEVPPTKYWELFTEGVAQDCRNVFTHIRV